MGLSDTDRFKLWQARGSVNWRWHCSLQVKLLVVDIDEQMFYNWDIATGKRVEVWEGCKMGEGNADEYKQKIIEIVNQIENIKILRLIFGFAKAGYEEEKAGS